jgi:hypothetical protein
MSNAYTYEYIAIDVYLLMFMANIPLSLHSEFLRGEKIKIKTHKNINRKPKTLK